MTLLTDTALTDTFILWSRIMEKIIVTQSNPPHGSHGFTCSPEPATGPSLHYMNEHARVHTH